MSGLSADPSWAETSVRWLEAYHPHYLFGSRMESAHVRLEKALRKMTYRGTHGSLNDDVWDTLTPAEVSDTYRTLAAGWSGKCHQTMTDWIHAGGYSAWKALRELTMPKVTFGTPVGPETIALEMPEPDDNEAGESLEEVVDQVVAELARAAADPTGENELDEILAAADKTGGAGYGTW